MALATLTPTNILGNAEARANPPANPIISPMAMSINVVWLRILICEVIGNSKNSDAMYVISADKAITDIKRMTMKASILTNFFTFPMQAFNAKALMGPSKGDRSNAPITVTGLSRKSPTRAIKVANSAMNKISVLMFVNFSALSTNLSKGLAGRAQVAATF